MTERIRPNADRSTPTAAFTLIEMLVVISIIALLIALLMPALSKARESGRRSVCLSNQHQLAVGMHTYAPEYKYRLPWIDGIYYSTTPWGGPYHLSHLSGGPVGMGLFLKTNHVSDPRVYYCPSMKLNWASYEENWVWSDAQQIATFGYDISFPNSYCYSSYEYARWVPGWNPWPIGPGQQAAYAPYSTIDRLRDDAIVYDSFYVQRGKWGHRDGYNVLYGDAHARFYADPQLYLSETLSIDLPSLGLFEFQAVIQDMNRY
jgi:prepilin-type N-terminal cleavage/methylation domain-containing protein